MSKLKEVLCSIGMLLLYFITFWTIGTHLWYYTIGDVVKVHNKNDKVINVPMKDVYSLNDIGRKAESDLIQECGGRRPEESIVYRVKWKAIYNEAISQGYDDKEAIELTTKCLGKEDD